MKPRILVTRKLKPESLEPLYKNFEVDMWESEDEVMPRDQLLARASGASGILCMLTDKIDKELLDAAGPRLVAISTMSVGFDHIDKDELEARGIGLGVITGVLNDAVADLTIALMLNTSRRIPEAAQAARSGQWGTWSPYWLTGHDLSKSTVGIVGLGVIGASVAKRLAGFDCEVLYSSRTPKPELEESLGVKYCSQDELLAKSDFVTVHTALTDDTVKMCNASFFSKMKSNSVFINTGRGALVDHDDLYAALQAKQIYAAGIDVTDPEPLPPEHPLYSLSNCLILPHIGSASISTRNKMANFAVGNLVAILNDKSATSA